MSQRISMFALLGTVSLTSACSADHAAGSSGGAAATADTGGNSGTGSNTSAGGSASTGGAPSYGGTSGGASSACVVDSGTNPCPAPHPPCEGGDLVNCAPSGFPFVQTTFAHSNTCSGMCDPANATASTIHLTQPKSGTLCLSGTNSGDSTGLLFSFTVFASAPYGPNNQNILTLFNADLLGITQFRFTIDNPPQGGVTVSADTMHSYTCNANLDCITWGFHWTNPITVTGTTTVKFADVISDSGASFDTRALDAISLDAPAGAFDFCVHDFQFLDANASVVLPKS